MAIEAARLFVSVGADVRGADQGLSRVSDHLNSIAQRASVVGGFLSAGVTAPLLGVGRAALRAGIDYQTSLSLFEANSEATVAQMNQVRATAKALGGDMALPGTSAADAAEAMTELAKAGLSVDNSLAAARGTLQLSAAGMLSNAEAAEINGNALNAFGLAGDRATMVADLLAATASKSSVEVRDVAESYKMASAVFSSFQAPVVGAEQAMIDLTTATGLLGNVGIKGSDAGTSLKQMLLQLAGPSAKAKGLMIELAGSIGESGDIAYTADGRMRSLREIIDLTARSTANLTEEERNQAITTIFGADASRAVIALMRAGLPAFDDMQAAVTRQGAAADLAAARTVGLGGAWDGLISTVETALLTTIEPFLGSLEGLVRRVADGIGALMGLDQGLRNGALAFLAVLAAAGPVLLVLGGLAAGAAFLLSPLGLLIAGIAALAGGLASGRIAATQVLGPLQSLRNLVVLLATGNFQGGVFGLQEDAPFIVALLRARAAAAGLRESAEGVMQFGRSIAQAFAAGGAGAAGGLLVSGLQAGAASIVPAVAGALQGLGGAVLAALPGLLAGLGQVRAAFLGWVAASMPDWVNAAGSLAQVLGGWVLAGLPSLLTGLVEARVQLLAWALGMLPVLLEATRPWAFALLDWVTAALPQLGAELGQLGSQTITTLGAQVPGIIQALIPWTTAFIGWLGPAIPVALAAVGGLVLQLLDAVGAALPGIVNALAPWGAAFIDSLIAIAPGLLAGVLTLATNLGQAIAERAPAVAAQVGTWAVALLGWVGPTVPRLLTAAGDMLGQLLTWIVGQAPAITTTLGTWAQAFAGWAVAEGLPALGAALLAIGSGLWASIQERWHTAFAAGSIGEAIISSIKRALLSNWEAFQTWFLGLFTGLFPAGGAPNSGGGGGGGWAPVAGGAPNSGGGGGGNGWAPVAGARALGGPVRAGSLYLVGERGPELFAAGMDGAILPNGSPVPVAAPPASGGAAASTTLIVNVAGHAITEQDLTDVVHQGLLRLQRQNGSLGFNGS